MRRQAGKVLHEGRWVSDKELRRLRDELEERRYGRGDMEARERYQRALVRKGHMQVGDICLAKAALAIVGPGSWRLPRNEIWNIPDPPVGEVSFENKKRYQLYGFRGIRGLVTDNHGCVYGVRSLLDPRQEGYQLHGRVSVGGKKHRAFTGKQLFERQDGSLVDVAVLRLHHGKRRSLFDYG